MLRRAKHGIGPSELDQAPAEHDRDFVGESSDNAKVVGDKDDPHLKPLLKHAKKVQDLFLNRYVESRGWLIRDQDFRATTERHRDHNSLLHTAAELKRIVINPFRRVGDTDLIEPEENFATDISDISTVFLDCLTDLVADWIHRIQACAGLLKNVGNLISPNLAKLTLPHRQDRTTFQKDFSSFIDRRRFRQKLGQSQASHTFATAAFANDGKCLSHAKRKGKRVDSRYILVLSSKPDGKVLDFKHRPWSISQVFAFVKSLLACLLFSLGLAFNLVAQQPKELVIGMELLFPPFEMLDTNGQPAGVGVDLGKALGEYLHRPVRIENIPFDGLIPSLKTGKVDIAISSMTITDERKRSIDFSDPYLRMGLAILANKNSDIQSIDDVDKPGRRVAVKKATTGHIYAMQHFKNAQLLVLSDSSSCATEVSQGKADCMIYDQISVFQHWKKFQDTTRAILKPFQQEEWGIGIRKGNDELRQQVNAFIKHFRETGGFDVLGSKYFSENKKVFQELGIEFYF
jgi:polar amino acid transport system substrate-binding protein